MAIGRDEGGQEKIIPPKLVPVAPKKVYRPPLFPVGREPIGKPIPVIVVPRVVEGPRIIFPERDRDPYVPGFLKKAISTKKSVGEQATVTGKLADKKYNVRTDTAPVDPSSASAVAPILYGGSGGGGYYGSAEMLEKGGFSLSDIPSIVWIVLAVGVGWFLIASSGGKGKGSLF